VGSQADLMFVPFLAIIILMMIALAMVFNFETSVKFEEVTDRGLSEPLIHSITSTMFKERNTKKVENYKAISYRLCKGPTPINNLVTGFNSVPEGSISGIISYLEFKVHGIPSQCSSASNYDGEILYGSNDVSKRDYIYEKKIPVIGGNVTEVDFVYELE